jgi:Tfp pilus assembly protein PilN
LNAALAGRVAWDRVLREMTLVLPSDVWLTDLSAGAPSTTTTSTSASSSGSSSCGSTGVCLTGNTYSQESVARALSRLSAVPELSNVQLLSSDEQDVGGQKTYVFKVQADLSAGGVS